MFDQLTIEDIAQDQLAIGDRNVPVPDQLAIGDRNVPVPPISEDPPPTEDTAMEDDRGSGGREVRPRISE